MKSICYVIVSLAIIFPLMINARPSAETSTERFQKIIERSLALETCAQTLNDQLRPVVQDIGGWFLDVYLRLGNIVDIRRQCDSIYMSDPPTRWELFQREACELRFQATIAIEVARITYEINHMLQSHPPTIRKSVEKFLACINAEIPDFQLTVPSQHRD